MISEQSYVGFSFAVYMFADEWCIISVHRTAPFDAVVPE
jgi:hypothetical protein